MVTLFKLLQRFNILNMINIDFEKTDGTYTLRDALWLPDDHNLSNDEIEAMKQERFDNWVAIITAPPVEEVVVDIVE